MAIQAPRNEDLQTPPASWECELRYVARQPILNLRGRLHAYELIFRNPPDAVSNSGSDAATRTMLDNAVIFGFEGLTNGLPAFVNCSAEALKEELVLVLAPNLTVLGIPANLVVTPKLLDHCRKLKSLGFRLALDDFEFQPEVRPLAEIADYIRIDLARFVGIESLHLKTQSSAPPTMIAKGVQTQADYYLARELGFTLFQGAYFCHPVLLKKRKLPANRMLHFEIIRMLHHDPIDIRQVSKLVLRDASMTYRLLRLVNSPIYALHSEVRSIEHAILTMGETVFRRIVSLAVLSEINGEEPPEILHMALVRARFCEKTASLCGLEPGEQYLLGMLSLVPAMLRLTMEELTPTLPLRPEICEALLGALNPQRSMLTWIECHERADWQTCDGIAQVHGLRPTELMQHYASSAVWAAASLHSSV
jgi:c-di-GMP phosphodiesterase